MSVMLNLLPGTVFNMIFPAIKEYSCFPFYQQEINARWTPHRWHNHTVTTKGYRETIWILST